LQTDGWTNHQFGTQQTESIGCKAFSKDIS